MKTFQLTAEPRTDLGKKAAKALRKEEKIPVVLNGGEVFTLPYTGTLREGEKIVEIGNNQGLITTDLAVTNDAVRKLIYTPDIFAIELDVHGEKRMAVLKDIQFHPVKDSILHMDLLEVFDKKPVVIDVPVKLEGHAEGVKAGGKLTLSMKKIKVRARYTEIPERLVVNVDNLGLGKTMQIGDLHFEGLEMVSPKEAVVCAVQLTRAARGAAAAAAALNDLPGGLILQHEAELHQLVAVGLVGEIFAVDVILPVRVQPQEGQTTVGTVDLAEDAGHRHQGPAAVVLRHLPGGEVALKGAAGRRPPGPAASGFACRTPPAA